MFATPTQSFKFGIMRQHIYDFIRISELGHFIKKKVPRVKHMKIQ